MFIDIHAHTFEQPCAPANGHQFLTTPEELIKRYDTLGIESAVNFDDAISSGNAIGYNGPSEVKYEEDFVEFMGGGYADGVNSGTNAVFCALGGLELEPFSEVICPPITDPGGAMHESYGQQEIDDIIAAIKKVEAAYLK